MTDAGLQMAKNRCQMTEVRRQVTEIGIRKAEFGMIMHNFFLFSNPLSEVFISDFRIPTSSICAMLFWPQLVSRIPKLLKSSFIFH